MKKSLLLKLLVLMLSLCSVLFVFTACGGDDEEPTVTCEHEWIFDEDETVYATTTATGQTAYKCSKCKETKTETMDKLIYLNGLESLFTENYGIKVTDLYFDKEYLDGGETYSDNYEISFGEIIINIDGEGNVVGTGSANILMLDQVAIDAKAYLENNVVYVCLDAEEVEHGQTAASYVKIPMKALFIEEGELSLEKYLEVVEGMGNMLATWFDGQFGSIFEDNALLNKAFAKSDYELNNAIERILNRFFEIKTENGKTTYTLSTDKFKQFNKYLYDTNIETMVNKFFGKDTFATLEEELIGLFDLSFGEILDIAEEYGFVADDVVDAFDAFLVALNAEIDKYEQISTPSVRFTSLNGVLSELFGTEIDVKAILEDEEFLAITIADVVEGVLGGLSEGEDDSYPTSVAEIKGMISAAFAYVKELTLYDFLEIVGEDKEENKQEVDNIIDLIGSYGSISFATDANGIVTNVDLEVEVEEGEVAFGGAISIVKDLVPQVNTQGIVEIYQAIEESIVFDQAKISVDTGSIYDFEFEFVEGKLVSVSKIYEEEYYESTYITTDTLPIDLEKSIVLILERENLLEVEIHYLMAEIKVVESYEDGYEDEYIYYGESTIKFNIDITTGEITFYG